MLRKRRTRKTPWRDDSICSSDEAWLVHCFGCFCRHFAFIWSILCYNKLGASGARYGLQTCMQSSVRLSFLVGTMWRHFRCRRRNVAIPMSAAQSGGLQTTADSYCPCLCLPFSRLTRLLTWIISSAPSVFGTCGLLDITFWSLCVSFTSTLMVQLVTNWLITIFVYRLVVCLSLYQRFC